VNAELCRKALEKVGNPNILVNLISRRVRQLNAGGSASNRPLVVNPGNLGLADLALTEVVEGKLTYELLPEASAEPIAGKRKRS
jgi:DNA-directed RNA polymerase subunit omega